MSDLAGTILVVDDDAELRKQLALFFRRTCRVETAAGRDGVRNALADGSLDPDVALVDMHLPPEEGSIEEGLCTAREIQAMRPRTKIIAMSGDGDPRTGIQAVRAGATDFFTKPIDTDVLRIVVGRAMKMRELENENRSLREEIAREYRFDNFIGNSPAMREVLDTVRKVADSNATVLIQGESGTGKELVARALHENSRRCEGPFIGVNCSAIPETLVESELFGHEKGSFTGAVERRIGRFEQAHGGTLFLDELATLNLAAQAKLLRVLETRWFERVGGRDSVRVDIRLIAATNQDLEADVASGRFREDLYYRIRVVSLLLPPLRERREDIPALVHHFLSHSVEENQRVGDKRISPEALERLVHYRWKGNVRELRHVIESLVLLSDGPDIRVDDLPPQILGPAPAGSPALPPMLEDGFRLEEYLAQQERSLLRAALQKEDGVKTRAARRLGVNKDRMKYLCRKHEL